MLERLGPFASRYFSMIIAVVLPLAGLLIALSALADHREHDARRIGAATIVGIGLYAIIFLG